MKRHNIDLPKFECRYARMKQHNLPALIYQFAAANNIDAILVASKGRDSFSSMIIGSVAEGLIEGDQYWPLVIVKSKVDHLGLGEALLNL